MELIPLQAIPNQSMPVLLGENIFTIEVQLGHSGGILLSVAVNDVVQVRSLLSVANSDMLPQPRSQMWGRLRWALLDGASYPDYKKFNTTHFLTWEAPIA